MKYWRKAWKQNSVLVLAVSRAAPDAKRLTKEVFVRSISRGKFLPRQSFLLRGDTVRKFSGSKNNSAHLWRDTANGRRSNALKARSTQGAARSSANSRKRSRSRQKPGAAIRTAIRACVAPFWLRERRVCPTTISSARSNAAQARAETASSSTRSLTKVTRPAAWPSLLKLRPTTETAPVQRFEEFLPRTTAISLPPEAFPTCFIEKGRSLFRDPASTRIACWRSRW